MTEKAYKILALQENISNREAKLLIDKGLVYLKNQKIKIARAEIPSSSRLKIKQLPAQPVVIFEDEQLVALEKPCFLDMNEIQKIYPALLPIHRLDIQTSGVLLMAKNDDFLQRCIEEFKARKVYKAYVAVVQGIVAEPLTIDQPIHTQKGTKAKSTISEQGKPAVTEITPLTTIGRKSMVQAVIPTGKTHQIRVHLQVAGYPIIGDEQYGGKTADRIYLHSHQIKILDYDLTSPIPASFQKQLET